MSQVEVQYCTSLLLSCRCDLPQSVYLCVSSSKVAAHACNEDSAITDETWAYSYIEATLNSYCKRGCSSSGVQTYLYTFEYDDTQLLPDTEITADDITGILCQDCLVSYIDDTFGNEPFIRTEEDGSLTFVSNHGCEYSLPNAGIDNILEFSGTDNAEIRVNTVDGADLRSLCISPAAVADATRGGFICLFGNEFPVTGGNVHVETGNVAAASIILQINSASGTVDIIDTGGTNYSFRDSVLYVFDTDWRLAAASSDGADNQVLRLCGGGTSDLSRGGYISVYGNEQANTGSVEVQAGNVAGANIWLRIGQAANQIQFRNLSNGVMWHFNNSGQLVQHATNGGYIILNNTDAVIIQGTSDGSDSKSVAVCGGGDTTSDRGGTITVYGNEYVGATGFARISCGNVGGAKILFRTIGAQPVQIDTNGLTRWLFESDGTLVQNGTNGSDLVLNQTTALIRQGTSDGADGNIISICGGGAATASRGAFLTVRGNETGAGLCVLSSGDSGGAVADIQLDSTGLLTFRLATTGRWQIGSAGALIGLQTGNQIRCNTSDGSDNSFIVMSGGGSTAADRGALLYLYGNEHANLGLLELYGGEASGGRIRLYARGDSSRVLTFDAALDTALEWIFGDGTAGQILDIHSATSDAADNSTLRLSGGGAATASRGAFVILNGNEASAGFATISSGDVGGTIADIQLNSTGTIDFRLSTTAGWRIGSAFALIGMRTDNIIRTNTSDGADNATITISGGGNTADVTRGGFVVICGNEHVNAGAVIARPGNHSSGRVQEWLSNTSQFWQALDPSGNPILHVSGLGSIGAFRTITAGGTTGNQTINRPAGSVNFAAAATTLTVTNSLVTANSIVICTVLTNDATATIKNVVPGAGSFVITLAAAATAETRVGFFVLN